MGQYYIAVILAEDGKTLRVYMYPHNYGNGAKLMEHSYCDSEFIKAFEYLICPDGQCYKSRIVWAGDYADEEPDTNENLFSIATRNFASSTPLVKDTSKYRYIVNHTKHLYIDKEKLNSDGNQDDDIIHPLPLLVSEGNGRGGGDYRGRNAELCGTWSRDIISVESELSEGYEPFDCKFVEY